MKKIISILFIAALLIAVLPTAMAEEAEWRVISEDPNWDPLIIDGETETAESLKTYCATHGHSPTMLFDNYIPSTCVEPGTQRETCIVCGAILEKEIPISDHSYDDGVCTVCGKPAPKLTGITVDDITVYDELDNISYVSSEDGESWSRVKGAYRFEDGVFQLNYEDGSQGYVTFEWLQNQFEDYALICDQTPEKPWEFGDHKVTLRAAGFQVEFTVHVMPSPVKKLEIDDFDVIEGTIWSPYITLSSSRPGIRIYYTDGSVLDTSKENVMKGYSGQGSDGLFENLPGEVLVQDESLIGTVIEAGKSYTFGVSYLGAECSFTIHGIKNPIASVEIKDMVLPAHKGGGWGKKYLENTGTSALCYWYNLQNNLDITMKFKDGSEKHVNVHDMHADWEITECDISWWLGWHVQFRGDWGYGSTAFMTPGKTYTVTAELTPWPYVEDEKYECTFHVTIDPNATFFDVVPGSYYEKPVEWAVENGITTGTDEGWFSPEDTCTRAQVVTFLWRAAGRPPVAGQNNPFKDVPAGEYYTDAVLWAVKNGVTTGTEPDQFSPEDTCTRAQIVTFLYRDRNK